MEKAVRDGNVHRVQDLIRSGADVNAQSKFGNHTMLNLAISLCHEDIALALLAAGADVHAQDDEGETALHWACEKKLEKVVQELIHLGSPVDEETADGSTPLRRACSHPDPRIPMRLLQAKASCKGLSEERKDQLFRHACRVGNLSAVSTLLEKGCCASTLSREEQEELLRYAYRERNLLVAGALFKNGCGVVTLSSEEQVELLHCACREHNIVVTRALLNTRSSAGNPAQTDAVDLLKQLDKKEKEGLLRGACSEGDTVVYDALTTAGCSVNCVSSAGDTPLMNAACKGHEEIVKKLILAGANLAMKDEHGDTALHYAAERNHIQCGVLLAEGGASLSTKNNLSQTPLFMAKADFMEGIDQALSFTTRKAICIIGNAEGGKSTLIESLQAENTGVLGSFVNRFRRMDDPRKRTAGIETVSHSSQKYGEVLFFDFAGQDDYHGPHQMFLEALLSKPGVLMTLLLVIKLTESEESILHQLHRWLTPVAQMCTTDSPAHVIIIGSFLDRMKSKQEAIDKLTGCITAISSNPKTLPGVSFEGTCFLNCRQPQSDGINRLCSSLAEIPVPEFKATHTGYSLAWVLSKIRSSFKAQALQLQELVMWIKGNKDNLPQTIPSPLEVCQDLSAAGHALYLPNWEDPLKSWLVLDLPSILHDVYGTLFSRSKEFVSRFGLLHCQRLDELFPCMDLAMIQRLLISLEFCIPVDPSVLEVELSELTQSAESSGWLFLPALVSTDVPQASLEIRPEQSGNCVCWQLRTFKQYSISARILQTILLRLAAHFVVKQCDEGVQQHYCNIWWNGITWPSKNGVSITVHIRNNRVIKVIATSMMAENLHEYLSDVISDILSTVRRLSPNLEAAACIVHPPSATSPEGSADLPPKNLFPVEGIRNSIREQEVFVFSLKDSEGHWNSESIADLFGGFTPTLEYMEKMIWAQTGPNQPQTLVELNQPTEGNGTLADTKTVPPGMQGLLGISATPNLRDVDELVVTPVAADWQRLALRLGVESYVINAVIKNHPNDYEGACRDMLDRWLRGERHTGEEERTWSTLLTALGRAGFVDLERSLQREHFSKE